ncbi:MAG: hypothetical protein NC548_06255 [Lachnospiraceae bacterium]|nr:hypothetical protein [Lachnospiraceae bacterium]
MRDYKDSDVFKQMDRGGAISNKLIECGKAINNSIILNGRIETMDGFRRTYRESIAVTIANMIARNEILLVAPPIDKRFPANIPYVKLKNGKAVVVDFGKYAQVTRDDRGEIISAKIDVDKMYSILVPAVIDLKLIIKTTVLPSETIKLLSIMWATMFNKVLMAKKAFVGDSERYEAFMYFAMRFFMTYYLELPQPLIDKISLDYCKGAKSKYIDFVEANLDLKNIDINSGFIPFIQTMFNNEVTNLQAHNTVGLQMDPRGYLAAFDSFMGAGSYLALWSMPLFLYCIFVTYNQCWILSDRAWASVVLDDKKMVPKLMDSLYKEL